MKKCKTCDGKCGVEECLKTHSLMAIRKKSKMLKRCLTDDAADTRKSYAI